jgi:hypothetical protein
MARTNASPVSITKMTISSREEVNLDTSSRNGE